MSTCPHLVAEAPRIPPAMILLMPATSSPRPTKRQELGARSRDEILNAALKMMSIYGYDGASVSRIAAESGLPSSSIYWHFGSKSGVLTAVMQRGAERFFNEPGPVGLTSGELDSNDRRRIFRETLTESARSVNENPEFLRLLYLLTLSGEHDDNLREVVRSVTARGMASLHTLIVFVYSPFGDRTALLIADRLEIFAQGVFDGSFMATQTHDGVAHADLIDLMADALLALGDAMAAELI
jgi:AcrR family transcriptional regulator